jgi:hypothetical protein
MHSVSTGLATLSLVVNVFAVLASAQNNNLFIIINFVAQTIIANANAVLGLYSVLA